MANLSQRDRVALIVGGVFVFGTLLYIGLIAPYQEAIARLDQQITGRQRQLREVQSLQQEYRQLQRQVSAQEGRMARRPDFSLFAFVEEISLREGAKEKLVYVRPKEGVSQEGWQQEGVEIRLEKIALNQLVQLLYQVVSADYPVQIKNLRIRTRFDDRSLLDASIELASFRKSS